MTAYGGRAALEKLRQAVEDAVDSGNSRATQVAIYRYFVKNLHVVAGCAHAGCKFQADPCPCECHAYEVTP